MKLGSVEERRGVKNFFLKKRVWNSMSDELRKVMPMLRTMKKKEISLTYLKNVKIQYLDCLVILTYILVVIISKIPSPLLFISTPPIVNYKQRFHPPFINFYQKFQLPLLFGTRQYFKLCHKTVNFALLNWQKFCFCPNF